MNKFLLTRNINIYKNKINNISLKYISNIVKINNRNNLIFNINKAKFANNQHKSNDIKQDHSKLTSTNINKTIEDIVNSNKKYNPELLDEQNKKINLINRLPDKISELLKLGRYDRPIGTLLLYWPCAWGTTIGALSINIALWKYISIYFIGAMIMRSSGCIINDMWDRNIDKSVERTKSRPLASGKITLVEASIFLSFQLAISLNILLQLPIISIISGLAIMPLVCIYPFMKRVTFFPQLILGFCFNSGAIICYPTLSLGNNLDLSIALPLYLGGILWTLIYDTIYAHMDKEDDALVGVKSTALFFGDKTKIVSIFLVVAVVMLFYYSLNRKKIVVYL